MKEVEIDNNINKNKEKKEKSHFTHTHMFSFQLFFSCFIYVIVVDKGKLFFSVSKVDVYQLKKRKANNKKKNIKKIQTFLIFL